MADIHLIFFSLSSRAMASSALAPLLLLLLLSLCVADIAHAAAAAQTGRRRRPPPPPPKTPPPHLHPPSSAAGGRAQAPPNASLVETAAGFSLYYGRNFKVIQNLLSNLTYLLLQQPVDFSGKDWILNISVFEDPLSNYTIDTTVPVGFLELLGLFDKLKGISASSISSPCLLELISEGVIPTIDITDSNEISTIEAMFTTLGPATSDNQSNFISFDSISEQGPLQRAEWIKFLAAFFNLEARANDIYGQIESNYQCLNGTIKDNSSAPLVAWLAYGAGVWTFSDAPYKLQLSSDAGGSNLDSAVLTMSFNMSEETDVNSFYNITSTLQVVIDETYAPDPSMYTLANFTAAANISNTTTFPFLVNRRLWRYDKRVGNNYGLDWLEGSIPQPQIVLRDLMEAFYPTGAYNTTYFRNIAMGENIVDTTTLVCAHNMTIPLQPTIIPCKHA